MGTDYEHLLDVLDNQAPERTRPPDGWERIQYTIDPMAKRQTNIVMHSHKIGFAFSKAGRLLGIYNWKE